MQRWSLKCVVSSLAICLVEPSPAALRAPSVWPGVTTKHFPLQWLAYCIARCVTDPEYSIERRMLLSQGVYSL